MNQPLYKFGDKVRQIEIDKVFVVGIISSRKGKYFYGEEGASEPSRYVEELLELYQEPQKKKAYAYLYEEQIFFSKTDAKWLNVGRAYEAHRAPEYDIEYPESLK